MIQFVFPSSCCIKVPTQVLELRNLSWIKDFHLQKNQYTDK